jgi:hypothetical protein
MVGGAGSLLVVGVVARPAPSARAQTIPPGTKLICTGQLSYFESGTLGASSGNGVGGQGSCRTALGAPFPVTWGGGEAPDEGTFACAIPNPVSPPGPAVGAFPGPFASPIAVISASQTWSLFWTRDPAGGTVGGVLAAGLPANASTLSPVSAGALYGQPAQPGSPSGPVLGQGVAVFNPGACHQSSFDYSYRASGTATLVFSTPGG